MKLALILVAAGRGIRAGGDIPKQWQLLSGRPVLSRTLAAFDATALQERVLVVHADDVARAEALTDGGLRIVPGGENRQASVRAGLAALQGTGVTHVLIHDAARPCVPSQVIDRVIKALDQSMGAAPALPVTDALWHGKNAQVTGVQERTGLYQAQTPQGFDYKAILAAHETNTQPAADDVAVARAAGYDVTIVAGDAQNIKITGPEDFARAAGYLRENMDIRLGNGYDVHRFGPGDHVTLCGIKLPHTRGLQGHSDADVGMHAVTDAIYGALAEGDIGQHFPPSDAKWKDADSAIFLKHAVTRAQDKGYAIANIDCTLVCEHPKIGPYAKEMRQRMAELTGVHADRISVKATTSERLGFTGREEGIAALATATLVAR